VSLQGGSGVPVPDDLVLVAHVSGPFGIAGWIRIRTYSPEASALFSAKSWWLDKPELHDVEVLQVRAQGEDLVARLMGIEGREAAENLQGSTIQIRRAHFPALDENEFYWVDLIGHEVKNLQGEVLGEVFGLMDNGAHPILRVAPSAGAEAGTQELLIPFVDKFVTAVDQAAKKITVDWERGY
jgi:16S rRNA processing protein RimM